MSKISFRMIIEDTFLIKSRGTVVVGKIESGNVSKGETIILFSSNMKPILTTTVDGIPMPNPMPPPNKIVPSLFFRHPEFYELVKTGMYLIKTEAITHE